VNEVDVDSDAELKAWYSQYSGDGSSADAIHDALAEAILSRALASGTRLREERLAQLFGVSRTPVREAIMRLESERLAARHRRVGLIVTGVSQEQILEIYVVREALDGIAARQAAILGSPADFTLLERLNAEMGDAADAADYARMALLNVQFHQALARASRNLMLQQFVTEVHRAVRRFRRTTFSFDGRAREAVEEHGEIIAAIVTGNAELAESLARRHMRRALEIRMRMQAEEPIGTAAP
jgi:DNA-binding GntR family transcriptional regulator